jgi:hypothetical protein
MLINQGKKTMIQTVDVLIVENNEYFNNLIFNALQQSTHFVKHKLNYKLVLHSFIDSTDLMRKMESHEFLKNNIVVFVDYKMNKGLNGDQIIKLLKKENSSTLAVMLSQSSDTEERHAQDNYDFFVIKDAFAPALCRLYLDQYIENKFL